MSANNKTQPASNGRSEHEKPRKLGPFAQEVHDVLQLKKYDGYCPPLMDFSDEVDRNNRFALSKVNVYKWMGLIVLTAIPLISAALSVLVTVKDLPLTWVVLTFSWVLTLFTVLNSIYKPSVRFHDACIVKMNIDGFKTDFLIELQGKPTIDDAILCKLVQDKKTVFNQYQESLISLLMPMQTTAKAEKAT